MSAYYAKADASFCEGTGARSFALVRTIDLHCRGGLRNGDVQDPDAFPVARCEAQLGVVVLDHVVSAARDITADQPTDAALAGAQEQLPQDHLLDASSKDATAHQPRVDGPASQRLGSADHDADHAVVAEDVGQSNLEGDAVRILFERGDLCFGVSAGG